MNNQEDYVTYPTAKLLKAAGYPQEACRVYDDEGDILDTFSPVTKDEVSAPHLWDALKWLREEKQVFIGINKCAETEIRAWETRSFSYYMATLCALSFGKRLTRCDTYEQACDAGIAAACKWLLGKNHSEKE